MEDYTVEKVWNHKGNVCVVVMTSMGHRCGYVGIKPEHPLYEIEYSSPAEILQDKLEQLKSSEIGKRGILSLITWDMKNVTPEIYFNVHGGITYSGGNKGYPIESDNLWWFGYDCAHLGDAKDLSVVSKSVREIEEMYPIDGVLRTLEYCIKECESLSNQLSVIQETN